MLRVQPGKFALVHNFLPRHVGMITPGIVVRDTGNSFNPGAI